MTINVLNQTSNRYSILYNAIEIGVILLNTSDEPFTITRGMRIAQAVLAPVLRATWHEVDDLDATERGAGGFGSTGH